MPTSVPYILFNLFFPCCSFPNTSLSLRRSKKMTINDQENGFPATAPPHHTKHKPRRVAFIICLTTCFMLILLLALVGFILGVTVFRVKEPKTRLVSTSLEGVAPKLSFPVMKFELNVTLNLTLQVENRNHASFKSGLGTSMLLYEGNQVGEAELNPGLIPARGVTTLYSNLTLEVDRFAGSGLKLLIQDVLDGQIVMEAKTRIPGRVNFLGIFKKHMVTSSDCHIVIGVLEFKVLSQNCKYHNKL